MAFYKIEDSVLLTEHFIAGPTYSISKENKGDYKYPIAGWYWYDTLEEALLNISKSPDLITLRQAKLVLLGRGLLETVDAFVKTQPTNWQIEWEYAEGIYKYSPFVQEGLMALGLSQEYIDALFIEASRL